ncbi:MAG: T9SS type A sorting domain-containing protein [Bacteroidales bacterium]
MKTKVKTILAIIVVAIFANVNLATAQNMSRWIELNVQQGETINFWLASNVSNTPIRVISGSTDTIVTVGTNSGYQNYYADSTVMRLYGDIKQIDCSHNKTKLTSVDASNNTMLTLLKCDNNSLTSLNASGLTALQELWCHNNKLSSLDVSGLTALHTLHCSGNSLTSIDVSGLTALKDFGCEANNLTSINLSGATALEMFYCTNNNLTNIDLSGLVALKTLHCAYNNLNSIDLSGLDALQILVCGMNNLTSLDVSRLTSLHSLYCGGNNFTTLAIDQIYCNLPSRLYNYHKGYINPIPPFTSYDSIVAATNSQNAIDRNWEVVDYYDMPIPTTGTYQCAPNASIKDFVEIKIYPNPANEVLCIIADDNQINSIEIYDIYGRLVLNKTKLAATKSTVDVSYLTNGVYVLLLDTTKGTTELKFVKQ